MQPADRALHGKTLPVDPVRDQWRSALVPGNPFAPIALTINRRCHLHYGTRPRG